MGHTQPTDLSSETIEAMKRTAIAGIEALGLDWCACHTEIKLGRSGPKLIEIGGRLGGDFITSELTTWSTGVDIVVGAIRLALGEVPNIVPVKLNRGAAIRYLAGKPGKLIRIDGLEEACKVPGITCIEFNYNIGDRIPEVESSGTRTAWIIAKCETREQAIKACSEAESLIRITTEI
jgi:biotin carboxylase